MAAIAPQSQVGVSSIDDARTIEDLIDRLRWSVDDVEHRGMTPGQVHHEAFPETRFYFVYSGAVELEHDGRSLTVGCGDFALLPLGGRVTIRATQDATLLSTSLTLQGSHPTIVRAMPSALTSLGFRQEESAFAGLLETIRHETIAARPGARAVVTGLINVVVSAAVRSWLERGCGSARTWLAAADDPGVGVALAAIHHDPGAAWTVDSLARVAHASRSQFAEQFRTAVGETPARYVARVRMARAEAMLRDGDAVSGIAFRLGYDSEAGFSRAFRRHNGVAPSRWRRADEQRIA